MTVLRRKIEYDSEDKFELEKLKDYQLYDEDIPRVVDNLTVNKLFKTLPREQIPYTSNSKKT